MTYTETRNGENVYTYSDCEYMLNGLLTNVEMPGTEKAYEYDGIGRLTGETVTKGATVSVSDTYSYDLRGNRTTKTGIDTTTQYTYDLNNRLQSITEQTADTSRMTQYYYDKNGNTISKATMEVATSTGDVEYTMSDTANSYVTFYGYNSYNLLTSAETDGEVSKYTYNADNLRTTKTVGNTTTEYVWDGQNLAAETKQGTTDTYTYDMTGVHTRKHGNIVTSYLKDYHGNVIGTADSTGRLDYDAYGNQIHGETPDPFGYCGEYYDSETGLIYLRNRYYDPSVGRFISEDTHWDPGNMIYGYNQKAVKYAIDSNEKIYYDRDGKAIKTEEYKQHMLSSSNILRNIYRQEGSQFYNIQRKPDLNAILQSSNLYAYVINNPIKYNDPSGESITLTIGGATIVATAIVNGIVYVAGAAAGIIMAADLGKKVGDVLKTRKGSIQNAPKPPGTPGWDTIRDLTMAEILRRAQKGETGFKTIWKLLNDGRFKK